MASLLKTPLTEAEITATLVSADAELKFLFEEAGIPRDVQAKVVDMGYTDSVVFAKLEDKAEDARKIFKADLDLDENRRGPFNAMVARLMSVWEAANKRGEKRRVEEAERKVGDLPRVLPKARHLELLRAYEAAHRELKDKDIPAPSYIEVRLEQLEEGEMVAEPLTEVICRDEAREDGWGAAKIMTDGTLKLQKASRGEAKPPRSSEELRQRIKVMGIAWEFIRLRFPTKPFLVGLDAYTWTDHVEWLLGDEVYGMSVKDHLGEVIFRPAWHTLLTFELESRKAAYKLVNIKGSTLVQALVDTRKDTGLLQRHFITPTAMAVGADAARAASGSAASSSRPAALSNAPASQQHAIMPYGGGRPAEGFEAGVRLPPQAHGGGRQNKGKGKGKGKGSSWKQMRNPSTPDGRQKCYRYNKGTCPGDCGRVHSCLICNGPHPQTSCPKKPRSGDAAGRVQ